MSKKHKEMLKHDPVAESIVHFLAKVKANKNVVVTAVLVGVVVIASVVYTIQSKNLEPFKASEALRSVASESQLKEIPIQYPGTFAAPVARIRLAAQAFAQSNYVVAIEYYDQILTDSPKFDLVPAVILAKAKCKIAMGDLVAAEKILRDALYEGDKFADLASQLALVKVLTMEKRYSEANAEMQVWEQTASKYGMNQLENGLRAELLRLSGSATSMFYEAENQMEAQAAAKAQLASQEVPPTLPAKTLVVE